MLVSIGVITGALVLTSGVLEGRYDLHMHVDQAEGLSQDTRVLLQGLNIGRVRAVSPRLDPQTNVLLGFVATLSIRERFADGTLSLPVGTRALITEPGLVPGLVGNTAVELKMPVLGGTSVLQPGDTIESERITTILDEVRAIANEVGDDVEATLEQTRRLLEATTSTLGEAQLAITELRPQTLAVLERLAGTMDKTDHILATIEPRVGPMADSVMTTLSDTRTLVTNMQTLVDTASSMANQNAAVFADIMQSLEQTAAVLAHFADQVTRRPLRLFTGVAPLDTTGNR